MMPSLAHVLLKRRSALSKDSFSLTFTSDMNFPPSRCEIRVRERLTFFTVHLGIIHKKAALVNKNKRIVGRKFDFSANFGFSDQKADLLSTFCLFPALGKLVKSKELPWFPPKRNTAGILLDSGCHIFIQKSVQSMFHAFFFSVFLTGFFSAFGSSVTFLSSTTIPRGGTFTRMLFW